jgi:hypothetical protein
MFAPSWVQREPQSGQRIFTSGALKTNMPRRNHAANDLTPSRFTHIGGAESLTLYDPKDSWSLGNIWIFLKVHFVCKY